MKLHTSLKCLTKYKEKDPYSLRTRVQTIEYGYHAMNNDECIQLGMTDLNGHIEPADFTKFMMFSMTINLTTS